MDRAYNVAYCHQSAGHVCDKFVLLPVGSPFIEADRQVQQIAKKLYANHDNLMDNNNPQKPSNKVNVPVDPSDVKLMNRDNTLDSFLFTNIDNHKPVSPVHSIEDNDALAIRSPPARVC